MTPNNTMDRLDFFSTGMFILDDIEFKDHSVHDIIGGAGIYAVLGAGLFLPLERRKKAGMIVDIGDDFPHSKLDELNQWGLGLEIRQDNNRRTTRGLNRYGKNEEREFSYLTPSLRIEAEDLIDNPKFANARVLHLICSPTRCIEICDKLDAYHKSVGFNDWQKIIWEPVPTAVNPQEWARAQDAFARVDVLSPNSKEAAMFFGLEEPETKKEIEAIARKYEGFSGLLVIRCGPLGCLVVQDGHFTWFDPYHTSPDKVIDPTGGGNSFLGGLGIGLAHNKSLNVANAVVFANIAAGLMIEQVGLPVYDRQHDTWNGQSIQERISKYLKRKFNI